MKTADQMKRANEVDVVATPPPPPLVEYLHIILVTVVFGCTHRGGGSYVVHSLAVTDTTYQEKKRP